MSEYIIASVVQVFTFPALGGFLFGYDIGATSFVVQQIIDGEHSGVKWSKTLDDNIQLQGAVTSASVFGALFASIIVFKLSVIIGRKAELQIGSLLYVLGAVVEGISANSRWDANTGLSVLILGRIIYGLGIGFSMHGAPAYIGEMSPPDIRGFLMSLKEAAIVVGILGGYLVGYLLSDTDGGWGYTFGAAAIPAGVMFFGCLLLHESARWLFQAGRAEEALASLKWVFPTTTAEQTLQEFKAQEEGNKAAAKAEAGASGGEEKEVTVWDPRFRPALIAGVGLVFLQQVTGQPSVLYYAAEIFDSAGLSSVATVAMAAFKLFMTMLAVFTVDRYGRKLLLYVGISVMFVSLVTLAVAFSQMPTDDDGSSGSDSISGTKVVVLVALFTYIGGYQIGFGPISWLLIAEVFPMEVRGQAVSLAVQTNFFWNVVTSYLFPLILDALGPAYTFGIFGAVDLLALYHVFANVPETKGLTLEQIEQLFNPKTRLVSSVSAVDHRPLLQSDEDDDHSM
jgi:sugar porter (SP) family MFS transporter